MQLPWLVLAVFVLAMVVDHLVLWRGFERRVAREPVQARHRLWAQWTAMLWIVSALVLGAWIVQARPLSALGLAAPQGWRLWAPALLVVAVVGLQVRAASRIARMTGDRARLREQIGDMGRILPRAATELPAWLAVSVTAGFCEELLFRGFLVWMLQPLAGWWGAAALAAAVFALAHAYQGAAGLLRTGVMAIVFTALLAAAQSLWPGIVLHAALDFVGGLIGWLALRDAADAPAAGAAADPAPMA